MTGEQLAQKAIDIAKNYKTSYIRGGLGRPITEANIQNAIAQYSVNSKYAAGARRFVGLSKAFFFDCVGLIKCILWGWNGDSSKTRGGAVYGSNGVPDINADTMINRCSGVSTDFSNVEIGEALWCSGHIGIYIGDGLGVECTPSWDNGVQITAVGNIGAKAGYNTRKWTKHGKLPYVTYEKGSAPVSKPASSTASKPATTTKKATDAAKSFLNSLGGTYKVTASMLNVRAGAGTSKAILIAIPKGTEVQCYGYYTSVSGTKWLSVMFTYKGVTYTGFVSSKYLAKKN